jgi:nitroreductase
VDVYEAVRSRRAVRSFLGRPVPAAALTRVLSAASRAPSGGNLQPWQVYLLSGSRLEDLKSRVRRRIAAGDSGDPLPVQPYPAALPTIYAQRLADMGERRYGAAGIAREDKDGRARIRARNWECFGAPTALFCYLDERMLPPQWMDAGIFLQSVMLLLRVEGLDSCPQIAWAEYHRTVAEVIKPPNDHILACGMSIGYADPQEPQPPMPRAPLSEVVTFLDSCAQASGTKAATDISPPI